MMQQASELNAIPHVVVGTPGRLVHQLKHDQFSFKEYLSNLQFLVLDEADRMLTDPTIQEDLTFILETIKEEKICSTRSLACVASETYGLQKYKF